MAYIEPEGGGKRLYAIRDWVHFVSEFKSARRFVAWSHLKKSLLGKEGIEVMQKVRALRIETAVGKKKKPTARLRRSIQAT